MVKEGVLRSAKGLNGRLVVSVKNNDTVIELFKGRLCVK